MSGIQRFGVDAAYPPAAKDLNAAGATFLIGYVSRNARKNWTAARITDMRAANIDPVFVFEDTANRAFLGHAAGLADGTFAAGAVAALGAPKLQPIYFAVDVDVPAVQMPKVLDYFRGVADALGKTRIGVYGGLPVIKAVLGSGLVTYAWQTYAWSAGALDPRANLFQYSNGHVIGGCGVDFCHSYTADFGQWAADPVAHPDPAPPQQGNETMSLTDADVKAVAAAVVEAIRVMPVDVNNYAEHPAGAPFETQKGRPFLAAFQDLCAYGSNASDKISAAVKK